MNTHDMTNLLTKLCWCETNPQYQRNEDSRAASLSHSYHCWHLLPNKWMVAGAGPILLNTFTPASLNNVAWLTNALDNEVHGANMGSTWGRQDPGWPHVGPMNFVIWGHSTELTVKETCINVLMVIAFAADDLHVAQSIARTPGSYFNIKMSSYRYRKSHCRDKTVVRSSYLHNVISYTGKMTSLY